MVAVIVRFVGSLEGRCMLKIGLKYLILMGMLVGSSSLSACSSSSDEDPSDVSSDSEDFRIHSAAGLLAPGSSLVRSVSAEDPHYEYLVCERADFNTPEGRKVLALFDDATMKTIKQLLDDLNAPLGTSVAEVVKNAFIRCGNAACFLRQLNYKIFNIYKENIMSSAAQECIDNFLSAIKATHETFFKVRDNAAFRDLVSRVRSIEEGRASFSEDVALKALDCCMNAHYELGRFAKDDTVYSGLLNNQAVFVLTQIDGRYCFELVPANPDAFRGLEPAARSDMIGSLRFNLFCLSSYKAIKSFFTIKGSFSSFLQSKDLSLSIFQQEFSLELCFSAYDANPFWQSLLKYDEYGECLLS